MKQEGSHARDLIARLVLDYMAANPHAADSAEGIRRWWLGAPGAATTPDEVQRALTQLVADGLMRCVSLADGTLLYSREPSKGTHTA